jgi:hypothetical protein
MAEFTSDVFKSTLEKPEDQTYDPFKRALEAQAAAAAKQYRGKYTKPTGADVPLAEQLRNKGTYQSGEFARREQAAQDKFGLAQSIDTRKGSIADRVRGALFNRQQMQSEAQDKMRQVETEAGLKTQKQVQDFNTNLGKLNFYSYQSAAERIDAMHQAYQKGILEFQMLDAARNNMLATADIDRYFSTIQNEWAQKLKTAESAYQIDLQSMINEFGQQSRATASIISGITDLATSFLGN